jgi:major membrane immunogen (membrane-anchored lipoprotein)
MKKMSTLFAVLLFASFALTACGSSDDSIEADAKKYADFMCKYQKLAEKAGKGDMSVISEYTKLSTEAATLATEMKGKYKDANDFLKFNTAYTKALEACSK